MANIKLVYINPTGGYVQPSSTSDVVQSVGKIELTGVGGVAIDAGGAKLSNLASPATSTDAATRGYVDNLINGLSWVAPVSVVATSAVTLSGSQTIDGVTPPNGARVLITGQNGSTPDVDNGIYLVNTSGAWTRSSDTLQSGTAMFVQSGTTYADTQWTLTTDSAITPGVTAIIFQQFGAGSSYSAGNGISIVGSTISVDLATVSGLEFATGELRIDVADTNELTIDANGLNVEGVPSLFKINGSAVSANVTAANLNTLTDGSSITSLHGHATIGQIIQTAAGLTIGAPVIISNLGTAEPGAASSAATAGIVAVCTQTTAASGNAPLATHGKVTGLSGLTAGAPYYLGDSGGLALYSAVTSGNRAIRIGFASSATDLIVNVQDMGVKP